MIFIGNMENIYKKINLNEIILNGRVICGALSNDWYLKNKKESILNEILTSTSFLNEHNPTLRERIFYIQKNITATQLCPHCKKNKLKFKSNLLSFTTSCQDVACKKIVQSNATVKIHSNFTKEEKEERAKKISKANSGSFVERYGSEKAAAVKNKIKLANTGKIQSDITKEKRINSRKNNGKEWHSQTVKDKISKSNIISHNSVEFKLKRNEIYKKSRSKLSAIMKNKILLGEFTPCITNSWTKWKSFVNIKNGIKKFRSNWEAVFWVLNNELEYEKIRIPYKIDGESKVYITDFYDNLNKIVYEIKPKSLAESRKNIIKSKFGTEWCEKNGMKYVIISDDWFFKNAKNINYTEQPQLKKSMQKFL